MSHFKSFVNCLPLFLVFGLISWIYISYTVVFCFYYVDSPLKRCSYVTATQILAVLFLWSFYESICQNHDAIPTQYKLTNGNSIQINHNDQQFDSILRRIIETRRLKIVTRSDFGTIRYCRQCELIKPDRTHHCSICKICVLKMDHHCPWLRNCIGHLNQKQFVLMLLYGAVICWFFMGTMLEFLLNNWMHIQEFTLIAIGFTTACLMGIIGLLLFVYNLLTVIRNQTTIESLHATVFEPDYLTFDLGAFENFSYVFGDKIAMWPIPITTASGNGYEFPIRMI